MVANLLLAVGGVLVVVAAVAFTAANWGSIAAAGRAAIVLGVAALALAAPWPLASRRLTATAEAIACIGLGLTLADAYLARSLAGAVPGGGLVLAAGAAAVLAACWAVYGGFAPVRTPRPAAIVLAQTPVPLAAAALSPTVASVALALVATAGADLLLVRRAARRQRRAECLVGLGAAGVAWLGGAGLALAGTLTGPGIRESFLLASVLVLGAVIGVLGARLGLDAGMPGGAEVAAPVTVISGALAAVGLALPVAAAVPAAWSVLAFASAGAAVAAAGWWRIRTRKTAAGAVQAGQDTGDRELPVRSAGQVAAGAAVVLGGAGLWAAPVASSVLWTPLGGLGQVWAGWPAFDHAVSGAVAAWPGSLVTPAVPAVLALASLACWQAPVPARDGRSCGPPRWPSLPWPPGRFRGRLACPDGLA